MIIVFFVYSDFKLRAGSELSKEPDLQDLRPRAGFFNRENDLAIDRSTTTNDSQTKTPDDSPSNLPEDDDVGNRKTATEKPKPPDSMQVAKSHQVSNKKGQVDDEPSAGSAPSCSHWGSLKTSSKKSTATMKDKGKSKKFFYVECAMCIIFKTLFVYHE